MVTCQLFPIFSEVPQRVGEMAGADSRDDASYMPAWLEPNGQSGAPIHPRERAAGRSRPVEEQVPEFGAGQLIGEIDCEYPAASARRLVANSSPARGCWPETSRRFGCSVAVIVGAYASLTKSFLQDLRHEEVVPCCCDSLLTARCACCGGSGGEAGRRD